MFEIANPLLDTGSTMALLGPRECLPGMWNDRKYLSKGKVYFTGGNMNTDVLSAEIGLSGYQLLTGVYGVHFVKGETDWLVGMPILRHFDLLLREARSNDTSPGLRPALCWPD